MVSGSPLSVKTEDVDNSQKGKGIGYRTRARSKSIEQYSSESESSTIDTQQATVDTRRPTKIQVTDHMANEEQMNRSEELNSSPIKKTQESRSTLNSSPISSRKTVVFSDDLVSKLPDTYVVDPRPVELTATPKRSILKPLVEIGGSLGDTNSDFSSSNPFLPETPSFWSNGTIVQLPADSPNLSALIEGSIEVLKNKNFTKRFEVYASLNYNFRINKPETIISISSKLRFNKNLPKKSPNLHNKSLPKHHQQQKSSPTRFFNSSPIKLSDQYDENPISILCNIIINDIVTTENDLFQNGDDKENNDYTNHDKYNPFSVRIVSQGLKLVSFLMIEPDLNNLINVDDARWFYKHACLMIVNQKISKTLIGPYISIIKECKFSPKKKRLIFNSPGNINLPEELLFSLLNMKSFPSSSLVIEKFVTLKNLVINFPTMMAHNFKHWFEIFLMNLCDYSSPLYLKIIGCEVTALLEIAKTFLSNKNIIFMVREILDRPVDKDSKSMISDLNVTLSYDDSCNNITHFDYITLALERLVECERYKQAMDIWVSISLLTCDKNEGYEKWKNIDKWINVFRSCLVTRVPEIQVNTISAWKAVIYNLCVNDLDDLSKYLKSGDIIARDDTIVISDKLKTKFQLLSYIISETEIFTYSNDVIETIDSCILSMVYTLMNPLIFKNSKFLQVYWDHLIIPAFERFYFKDTTIKRVPFMGIKLLVRLLKKCNSVDERSFNPLRCLGIESVSTDEINSLSPRWAIIHSDKILHLLLLSAQCKNIKPGVKISLLATFTNTIKGNLLKENQNSAPVLRIIKGFHDIYKEILVNEDLTLDNITKIFSIVADTFLLTNISGVELDEEKRSEDLISLIINTSKQRMSQEDFSTLCGRLVESVESSKRLPLLLGFKKTNLITKDKIVDDLIVENLKTCKFNVNCDKELKLVGSLFELMTEDYHAITKCVIQDLVLLKEKEFERALNLVSIQKWSLPIFKFFVILVHDAPYNHLKQMTFNLILLRWEKDDTFIDMIRFLIENNLNLELFNIRKPMMKRRKTIHGFLGFEFKNVWKSYLIQLRESGNFILLDQFLMTCFESDFEIKPLIHNEWDRLPLLKEAWLKQYGQLYIESHSSTPNTETRESPVSVNNSLDVYNTTSADAISSFKDKTDQQESLSDEESDVPDNTFSLETGNDRGDDSIISTDDEIEPESFSSRKRLLCEEDEELTTKKPKPSLEGDDNSNNANNSNNPTNTYVEVKSSLDTENLQSISKSCQINHLINSIDETDLKNLSTSDVSTLETNLLEFLLKIRKVRQ